MCQETGYLSQASCVLEIGENGHVMISHSTLRAQCFTHAYLIM